MINTKEIRKQMKKELGYNAKQVSVGSKNGNCTFTIRDAKVNKGKVKEFANNFEKIDRCQMTGEILLGGNTFVNVYSTDEVKNVWAAKYIDTIKAAVAKLEPGATHGKKVEGLEAYVWNGHWKGTMHISVDNSTSYDRNIDEGGYRELALFVHDHS